MVADIIYFPVLDGADMDPDRVLDCAKGELQDVIILGLHKDGSEYFAGSLGDGSEILWRIERLKWLVMRAADEVDDD